MPVFLILFIGVIFGLSKFVRNNTRIERELRGEAGDKSVTPVPDGGDIPPHHHFH